MQAGKNGTAEALHRAVLAEEPADQPVCAIKFRADDRGAQRDRVRIIHFTKQFAASIKVDGVFPGRLRCSCRGTGENTVGAYVDQARICSRRTASQGDAAAWNSLEWLQRIICDRQLLNEPDTIDYDSRVHCGEKPCEVLDVVYIQAPSTRSRSCSAEAAIWLQILPTPSHNDGHAAQTQSQDCTAQHASTSQYQTLCGCMNVIGADSNRQVLQCPDT